MPNKKIVIKVTDLSKVYKIYKRSWYRILSAFTDKIAYKEFSAVKDVTLAIPEGETVGIVGKNGHGKSTLLKMITGVTHPTSGRVETKGRIVAMLELTSGFDKELTGRENIYIRGLTIGLSKEEITKRLPAILDFADIGDFIDQPLRTYSSGMKSRLGFAVSVNLDPDILIVDEVLAVGDVSFKLKCLNKMEEFRQQGKTILFVSHDLTTVKAFCSKCVWMREGKLVEYGETGPIVQRYQNYLKSEQKKENKVRASENHGALLSKDDVIHPSEACIFNNMGEKTNIFNVGDDIHIYAKYEVKLPNDYLNCAITVLDSDGKELFGTNRQSAEFSLDSSLGVHSIHATLKNVNLLPGSYLLCCSIWNIRSGFARSALNRIPFEIVSDRFLGTGIVNLKCEFLNYSSEEDND